MERKISIKIDNMIRNYCYNFLSYLYVSSGWKRVMFEIGKENHLGRNRILISNTGSILITCFSLLEFLECMSFIQNEFENSRMGYYLFFDEETILKHDFVEKIEEKKEEVEEEVEKVDEKVVEEEEVVEDVEEEDKYGDIYDLEERKMENKTSSEKYIFGVLFMLSLTKLCELF